MSKFFYLLTYMLIISGLNGGEREMKIYKFSNRSSLVNWSVVDDGVMGGYSKGKLKVNTKGNGVFSGEISLYNYGGFSSLRYYSKKTKISPNDTLVLRVNGDNKFYQIRIRHSQRDRHVYVKKVFISDGWKNIEIPLSEFSPSFRGRSLRMGNFNHDSLTEIGILIGNKIEENFILIIDSISIKSNDI